MWNLPVRELPAPQGEVGGARLEAAIADNCTQFGITGGPTSPQSDVSTVVAGVAGVGSNTGVQLSAAVQPSAPSPVPEGSFSAAA